MSMSDLGGSFGPPAPVEAPPQRDRARDLHEHVARTLKLAFPIILARMGMPLIFLVDTVMVARAGTIELAYFGLAVAPQFLILMTSVGFMQGVMILVSHANGAKHFAACGLTWHIGLLHALVLGSVFSALSLFTQDFLLLVGQSPDLVAGADRAVWAFSWGVTGQLFFMCTTYFLEATGRPGIGVIAILVGNILNVVLNFVLIYGWGDLVSPMGAAGAAHATSVVRWCMFLIVLSYLIYDSRRNKDRFHVRIGLGEFVSLIRGFGGPVGVRLRRLGTPIALAMGLEAAAMATMILLAGYLGAVALAAHQIAINSIMLAFMVAIGTGGATAVRVGNAVGRFDPEGMRRAGWTGVCLGGLLMAPAERFSLRWRPTSWRIFTRVTRLLFWLAAIRCGLRAMPLSSTALWPFS